MQNFGSNVLRGAQGVGQAVGRFGNNIKDDLAFGANLVKGDIKRNMARKMKYPQSITPSITPKVTSPAAPPGDYNQGFGGYMKNLKEGLNY